MARTKKPCMGCGQVVERRAASELCYDCKETLKLGRQIKKRFREGKGETGIFLVAEYGWAHWYPHIHVGHSGTSGDEFRKAFDTVIRLTSQHAPQMHGKETLVPETGFGYSEQSYPVTMKSSLASALRRLYLTVQKIAGEAYKNGKNDGHDLLSGLASGDLSVKDFNAASGEKIPK